jgi:hypothetical protein
VEWRLTAAHDCELGPGDKKEDKEKWEKVVANSQLMEDGEGVCICSFRNVSLGKLPVRTLAVAPSLSYRESPTRLPRGHAVLSAMWLWTFHHLACFAFESLESEKASMIVFQVLPSRRGLCHPLRASINTTAEHDI